MNDLQFAGRYQCLSIRCSGRLISLQNEHPKFSEIMSSSQSHYIIVTGQAAPGTKNGSAGEGQHQFTRNPKLKNLIYLCILILDEIAFYKGFIRIRIYMTFRYTDMVLSPNNTRLCTNNFKLLGQYMVKLFSSIKFDNMNPKNKQTKLCDAHMDIVQRKNK
jgi:hypothetical protein